MAESTTTKTIEKALNKALRDLGNYKKQKPTIQSNIETLIKNSEVGSTDRQKYVKMNEDYKRKLKTWQEKYDQYNSIADGALKAYQASVKLDPIIKKQQDNTDLGVVDPELNREANKIKRTIEEGTKKAGIEVTPAPTLGGPTGTPAQAPSTPASGLTPAVVTSPIKKPVVKTLPKTPVKKPVVEDKPVVSKETKALTIDEIIDAVANEYGSIDTIFKTDPGLQALLRKAIGKDGVPNTDDDLTADQFVNELENTSWFKTNASAVRQRGFYKRQFDDLVKQGGNLEDLYKTTEYGRGLKFTQQVIADEIKKVGASLTPEEIDLISRDIYDLGYENQKAIVSQRIRAKIAYKPGGIVGGEAGENLADLKKTAKSNGLDLEKNFGSSIQGWLQKLAQGESIETFKQIIRSTAKLGLPEKVSSLLDQGVDLDTIYNPYKRLMASVLEINPESITLDDQVLRSAIGPDKEMSLYDYQKMLRKDNRWQFTNQAKEEVSDTALRVLRDFGFQG